MADIQANIGIGVDTTQALASIRQLQREISVFHTLMAKGGAKAAAESRNLQQNLVNSINETGKFSAGMTRISSSTESFTNALEKNKLSMGQYFRYAGGASKSFGKMFSKEFNTISRVATERVKDLQTQYIAMGRDANGALQSIKVRPLALDMNNLGTKVQLAAQKQQLFNQVVRQGTTNLLNFGKNTQWAGRQLMVGFTLPLTIFGATAIKEFQKIEEQAVKFKRVYGDMFNTNADTEKALDNVRQLAEEFTKYGIAVEKTIGLAAKAAQMGNTGSALTAQVTEATRLAVLGGIEQQEALDTTISLTNAFGIAAEDLAGKIDFLNAAENQTILSIEDFNTAIPLSGSVVQQLGGDVEDLAVLLTAMREGGINASQAGNALKSSLARLIAPSRNAKETLSGFGIDVLGIVDNNAGNLMGTINTLAYSLNELDPLSRAKSIEALFGKFQFARMSTLFSNIVKEGSQASKVLGLTANSAAELGILAERELKRVEESPAFKLSKQMEQLKAALAPIGAEFVKAILPIVEFGTKILKAFNGMGEGGKQFVVVLTAIAGVVAPAALMAFGLVANGIANLIKFFRSLGDAFGMLSGRSTLLGGQTEYMTQQQIEAAAVAASLGQSHSNLTQVFTTEASAVANLVTQYRAAIAQQRQLSIGMTAAGVARGPANAAPKKYASGGIISGPGTGTSDSIPAMVSNGEFVTNAKRTKQYLPLLQAIAEGKVPGFASPGGGSLVGMHLKGPMAKTPQLLSMMDRVFSGFSQLSDVVQRGVIVLSDLTAAKSGPLNQAAKGSGLTSKEFSKGWKENAGRGFLDRTGARGQNPSTYERMVADKSVAPSAGAEEALVDLDNKIEKRVATKIDQIPATEKAALGWLDRLIDSTTQEIIQEFSVSGDAAKAEIANGLASRGATPVTARSVRVGQITNPKTGEQYGDADAYYRDQIDKKLARVDDKGQVYSTQADGLKLGRTKNDKFRTTSVERNTLLSAGGSYEGKAPRSKSPNVGVIGSAQKEYLNLATESAQKAGIAAGDGLVDGAESSLQISSPSKRMFQIGKDGAQGLINGAKETFTKLQGKAVQVGQGIGEKINASPTAQRAANYLGGYDLDAKKPPKVLDQARMQANRDAKAINQDLFDKGYITEDMQQTSLGQSMGITPVRVVEGQIDIGDNSIDNLANVSPAANDAAEQDKLNKPMQDQRAATETFTESIEDSAQTQKQKNKEDKAVLKESKRQNRGNRATKALGALGTATMVAGMATQVEGQVGEVAQKLVGPMAALSGIAPMLMALPAPIAALVAVIGSGVAIWYLYNKAMDKAYDKTYDLSRAMGSSTEAMNKFAEFAGTVTAGENMAKRREGRLSNYATAPGKQTFGSAYLESDSGQEFANSVRSSLTSLGKDQTVSMIFQQMGAAISQNILTAEQARSIVGNLGIELSNLSLSAEVNSQLVSVFGPNGENLLEEPLVIPAIMAEMQTDALAKSFEEYEKTSALLSLTPEQYQQNFNGSSTGRPNASSSTGNPEYQAAIAAEKQRRIDSGEVEGWWDETMLRLTPDPMIANEIMQKNLGQVSGNMQNSLENQQAVIDTMRVASEDRINKAIEEGADYSAIAALREEEADALDDAMSKIRGQTQTTVAFIEGLKAGDQETVRSQQKDRLIANAPEGTDKGALGKALIDLFNSGDFGANFTLSSAYEAGQLTLDQLMYLADLPPAQKDIYYNISTNLGAGEAAQIMQVAETIKDETVRQQFELSFDGLEGTELTDAIAMSEQLARMATLFSGDLSIPVGFMLKPENEEAMASFMANLDKITLDAAEGGWDKNIELVTSILGAEEVAAAQRGILANQAEFDALPDELQLQYGAFFTMFMDLAVEDDDLLKMAEAATGLEGEAAVAAWIMDVMPAMSTDNSTFGEAAATTTGSGGEKSVDSLLKKLRDLRIATIDMKKGWEGMQEVLAKTFAGDGKGFDVFSGLSNQIRKMGVGENLIEMIVGMDPDEYAKRKDELFTFDASGNITGTTSALKNLSSAFNSIAIGEYINSQQSFIQNTHNQFTAMNALTASGMSVSDAYEAVQDSALAAAIAMGATKAEIDEIVRITALMKEQQDRKEAQDKRISIQKSVKEANQEFKNQVDVLKKLSKAQGEYTDAQIRAILGDKNLQAIFLDPKIGKKELENALKNAEQQANLDIQINLLTKTGQETEMAKYAAEVSDYFSRNETAISLDFELATADDNKILTDAQNQIADIQYKLDDYNAEIEQISWLEDDINEKYDKRSEALDNIAEANDRISQQQKAQLSIADALSQGDIAAAARAVQELKEQQTSSAQEDQKTMLDRAREAELGSLRGPGGMTRKELEEVITELERQVFLIEEQSMEPAQERIRLAEVTKNLAIERLELEGKSRMEWEQISSSTALAAMSMEDMVLAAKKMAALSGFIKTGEKSADWNTLFPQPVAAAATPRAAPKASSGVGGSSSSAPTQNQTKLPDPDPNAGYIARSAAAAVAKAEAVAGSIARSEATFAAAAKAATEKSRDQALTARAPKPAPKKYDPWAWNSGGWDWATTPLWNSGGLIPTQKFAIGGRVMGLAAGGYSMGSDIVPAMLTPGEFVIRKRAVQNFGMDGLEKINNGSYADGSVYTYNLAVNVNSDSDPSRIARAVITQIKRVDSQRIRTNKL
jgi:TP901 family phage tail tape measure protein